MWKGAYLLTRMAERYKETNKDLHKEILAIRDDLDANNYSEIPQWGAAAAGHNCMFASLDQDRRIDCVLQVSDFNPACIREQLKVPVKGPS